MKIGVYSQALKPQNLPGIGYYLYHVLKALIEIDKDNTYHLITNGEIAHNPSDKAILCQSNQNKWLGKGFLHFGLPKAIRREQCDVAFIPKELIPPRISVPIVASAYDLFFLKLPKELKHEVAFDAKLHFFLAKRSINKADRILAISEDTKKDLIEICNVPAEKVIVTPLGCDASFFVPCQDEEAKAVLQKHRVVKPYFINTSSYWWGRKNLIRMVQAFSNVKKRHHLPHQLIITGQPGPSMKGLLELIVKEGLADDVLLLNYIPRSDLIVLLQRAEALVFPSLHEGFGLPVIEAMAASCPVITSNTSALKEIGTGSALLVEPYSVESIEEAMEKIVFDEQLKLSLKEKGKAKAKCFTWQETAKQTLEVLHKAKDENCS